MHNLHRPYGTSVFREEGNRPDGVPRAYSPQLPLSPLVFAAPAPAACPLPRAYPGLQSHRAKAGGRDASGTHSSPAAASHRGGALAAVPQGSVGECMTGKRSKIVKQTAVRLAAGRLVHLDGSSQVA